MRSDLESSIVVGGGIMGTCTAWSMVKQGMGHVTLIDSFELPRIKGSASVDGGRAIRYTYGKDVGYMIMVADAYEAWYELFQDLEETLYTPTGTLLLQSETVCENPSGSIPSRIDSYNSIKKYQELLGIDIEYLTQEEAKNRFKGINFDDIEYAIYTTSGGVLHAGDIVSKTVEWLKHCPNVTVLDGPEYEVVKINTKDNDGLQNENNKPQHSCTLKSGKTLYCDNLVLATNCFTDKIVSQIKNEGKLVSSRNEATFFKVPDDELSLWKSQPLIFESYADLPDIYWLPFVGGSGTFGVKGGARKFFHGYDLNDEDFEPKDGFNQPLIDWSDNRFIMQNGGKLEPIQGKNKVCYFDEYPEDKFQMHPLGDSNSAVALYGFSGHGFKFGSIVGKATASVMMRSKTLEGIKNWLAGNTTLRFFQVQ